MDPFSRLVAAAGEDVGGEASEFASGSELDAAEKRAASGSSSIDVGGKLVRRWFQWTLT
jgi:hypothetical protein